MNEGNISQKFRLKNIDEIKNYLIEEINKNELMSKKHKKVFNYIEHLLILISTVSGCVSISAFASLVGVCVGIASSPIGLKICVITAGIKKLIIKKKKHDKHCYPIVWSVEQKTESKNPKVVRTKNERITILAKCLVCNGRKSKFIKEQEAGEFVSSLGVKTSLSKIPLRGPLLLWEYKINEIVNRFLLAGDKSVPKKHLKQPGFTYSVCGSFTEAKERIKKIKETGNSFSMI